MEHRLLDAGVVAAARELLALARARHLESQALEAAARNLIATSTGIDFSQQEWSLDLERGVLSKEEAGDGQPDQS